MARHTFAQEAGDKIPLKTLQRLYRHRSIVTTMGYQSNFTTQEADDALDTVLGSKPDKRKRLQPKQPKK